MTDRPVPWVGVFNYLADLADAKQDAAAYAMKVRTLYDVLVEELGDAEAAREFLLFHVPMQHGRGLISNQHCKLALKLLPKPPRRKRGRPEGARGGDAYNKRYDLYRDWNYEKSLNPSLTKEQFTKKHLGITDTEFDADFDPDDPDRDGPLHMKAAALLQDLKPARMKQLDQGQRRALELIYQLAKASDRYLALKWREAKQNSPALTKEDFLQEHFGWRRDRKRHPIETDMIHEYLEKLNEAEKQLTNSVRA